MHKLTLGLKFITTPDYLVGELIAIGRELGIENPEYLQIDDLKAEVWKVLDKTFIDLETHKHQDYKLNPPPNVTNTVKK